MTPYKLHAEQKHRVTLYSPNGIDRVEECQDCGARFLHNPAIGYPLRLDPMIRCAECGEWRLQYHLTEGRCKLCWTAKRACATT
jgi:ribosomal protein L32